jgi:gamma-glutamyltranspeptidase/glutathione hydrolase
VDVKGAVGASERSPGEVARDVLTFGNAVDAVVAGVLMAAAETPTVFLGPVQILIGGHGAGLRAVDGRVRQPGRAMPRPRGVPAGEPVPPAAWVGVPALPGALALVVASLGSVSLWRLSRDAVAHAKQLCAERAAVLEAFAGKAAAALASDAIAGELAAVAGRSVGGALTREDLGAVRPVVISCDERFLSEDAVLRVPWKLQACDGSHTQVVAAADSGGLVAVACYESGQQGLAIAPLGLVAPAFAAPVRRGEARVRPGEARSAAAPIALRAPRALPDLALGIAASSAAEATLDRILTALGESPAQLGRALALASEGRPVSVVCACNAAALAGARS